ncbi:hypothetical protein Tco_1347377 [Tanacetum coccineum]
MYARPVVLIIQIGMTPFRWFLADSRPLSDLNCFLGGFMDYFWSRKLNISNFGPADRKILPMDLDVKGLSRSECRMKCADLVRLIDNDPELGRVRMTVLASFCDEIHVILSPLSHRISWFVPVRRDWLLTFSFNLEHVKFFQIFMR